MYGTVEKFDKVYKKGGTNHDTIFIHFGIYVTHYVWMC